MGYEVQQTRWDRIVRRVTGSVGAGSRVAETVAELIPVLDIERVPLELLLLGGTQPSWGQTLVGPVALEFPFTQVLNPGGSGNILTVTSVVLFSDTAQLLYVAITDTPLATADSQAVRDSRRGTAGQPIGQCRVDTSVVLPVFAARFRVPANTTIIWKDSDGLAVLSPGFALQIAGSTLNTELAITWLWRERPAEESELQF